MATAPKSGRATWPGSETSKCAQRVSFRIWLNFGRALPILTNFGHHLAKNRCWSNLGQISTLRASVRHRRGNNSATVGQLRSSPGSTVATFRDVKVAPDCLVPCTAPLVNRSMTQLPRAATRASERARAVGGASLGSGAGNGDTMRSAAANKPSTTCARRLGTGGAGPSRGNSSGAL